MGDEKCSDAQHFSDLIQSAKDTPKGKRTVQLPSDLAYIPYSSGTTGLPKGVMLTQRNMIANCLQTETTQQNLRWNGGPGGNGDTILAVLPFYHVYGRFTLLKQAKWLSD